MFDFLGLPIELRNDIYEQLLVHDNRLPIGKDGTYHDKKDKVASTYFTLGLLLTCKQIHEEASSVLFAHNLFVFCWAWQIPRNFLNIVGRKNASSLRHIIIAYPIFKFPTLDHLKLRQIFPASNNLELHDIIPAFERLKLHDIIIEKSGFRMLERIQQDCTGLVTLETHIDHDMDYEIDGIGILDIADNLKVAAGVLAMVNTSFKAISSLQNMIIEVEEYTSFDSRNKKQEHNQEWTLRARKSVENDYDHCDHGVDGVSIMMVSIMTTTSITIVISGKGRLTALMTSSMYFINLF